MPAVSAALGFEEHDFMSMKPRPSYRLQRGRSDLRTNVKLRARVPWISAETQENQPVLALIETIQAC